MCDICHHTPCPAPCPSNPTPAVGTCAYCADFIYAHEPRLLDGEGRIFHVECLEALDVPELLAQFGVECEVIE